MIVAIKLPCSEAALATERLVTDVFLVQRREPQTPLFCSDMDRGPARPTVKRRWAVSKGLIKQAKWPNSRKSAVQTLELASYDDDV